MKCVPFYIEIHIETTQWKESDQTESSHARTLLKNLITVSMSGRDGIAPLSVVVMAPQAFANLRASRNRPSFSKIDKSFASWVKMPAQNASPAPVVSTTCTLSESTLPLNFGV
jgi:hypothetical protein